MNFLDAFNLSQNSFKKKRDINIFSSFNPDALNIFIKALFARKRIQLSININPFDTLKQTILKDGRKSKTDIYLILPWDFCEQLNWRNGLFKNINYFHEVKNQIDEFLLILKKIKNNKIIYFDLPIPKFLLNKDENHKIINYIKLNIKTISDLTIQGENFSLDRFLGTGIPFKTSQLLNISKKIFNIIQKEKNKIKKLNKNTSKFNLTNQLNYELNQKKILAVDFDDTLWKGVIADEGYKKINCRNDVIGYKHYVFQNLIKHLKSKGILIVGVTKNNLAEAKKGFLNKNSILKTSDFIKILASYEKKSFSIEQAYKSLNLTQDSVVFVDDNIIEVKEVKTNLPKVKAVKFPKNTDEIPQFIEKINFYFQKKYLTKEDLNRVNNYKNNFNQIAILKKKEKFNLLNFLKGLKMSLIIKRLEINKPEDLERPFQLINKTNQFNLNGIRLSETNFLKILKNNGKLFSGFYKDKTGDFGEIITILVDRNDEVRSFVMSCRVFQRKIENIFLTELINEGIKIKSFLFKKTNKNQPLSNFFNISLKDCIDKKYNFKNKNKFIQKNKKFKNIFKIKKINF